MKVCGKQSLFIMKGEIKVRPFKSDLISCLDSALVFTWAVTVVILYQGSAGTASTVVVRCLQKGKHLSCEPVQFNRSELQSKFAY